MKEQFSSESNEWYTPPRYPSLAKQVMGGIALDPASCIFANQFINADEILTLSDDGLSVEWIAPSVWLNPPYGKFKNESVAGIWARNLISEYEAKRTKQATLLVNACTPEKWFKPLWNYPICFTDHRIKFISPPGIIKKNQPTKGSAFVYFGDRFHEFKKIFSQIGNVV